jgi:hypothetical protein
VRPLLRRIYAGAVGALLALAGVWLAIWALFEYGSLPGLCGSLGVVALGVAGVWISLDARASAASSMAVGPSLENYRDFTAAVVGVKHENCDGSSRQKYIRKLRVGDPAHLVREPTNPHDRNAVAVLDVRHRQIGYLDRDLASELAPKMDAGHPHPAQVVKLLHGESSVGAVIQISTPRETRS